MHSHQALHNARLVTLAEKNATAARRHMSIARLAHLRVARFFIKTMCPFSHCEDASYREQASPDWVACLVVPPDVRPSGGVGLTSDA